MAEVSHFENKPLQCMNPKCKRFIAPRDRYFLDTLWDRVYCHQCGLCLRYARKKAMQRGESMESAEIES